MIIRDIRQFELFCQHASDRPSRANRSAAREQWLATRAATTSSRTQRAGLASDGAAAPADDAEQRVVYDASTVEVVGRIWPVQRTAVSPVIRHVFGSAMSLRHAGWTACRAGEIRHLIGWLARLAATPVG